MGYHTCEEKEGDEGLWRFMSGLGVCLDFVDGGGVYGGGH